ncbi:MAG: RNA polymerase sigma factor [Planctomycetota bacterium]
MRDDRSLLRDLRAGDKTALRCIYERYKDDLLTIAACLLVDRAAAEDCLHDVFVAYAAGAGPFRLRNNLRGYLASCVANRARDRLRKTARQVSLAADGPDPAAPDADPASQAENREQAARLHAAVADLPFEQREVITLHLHGGMTFRKIARQQGVSINTAQSRYRYGIDKLRTLLAAKVKP